MGRAVGKLGENKSDLEKTAQKVTFAPSLKSFADKVKAGLKGEQQKKGD
jgi:hypothetical protein